MKWLQRLAGDASAQVTGERARLADRKLRSWRTRLACLCIGYDGAVTQRPKPRVTPHRERVFDENGTAFVPLDRQLF